MSDVLIRGGGETQGESQVLMEAVTGHDYKPGAPGMAGNTRNQDESMGKILSRDLQR